jgi:hypothetical protein
MGTQAQLYSAFRKTILYFKQIWLSADFGSIFALNYSTPTHIFCANLICQYVHF